MGERKRSYFENGPTLGEPSPGAPSEPPMTERGRSSLGVELRSAREAMGLGLDEVARDLRIRRSFLQALEEGRFKDLPGVTYATGFLRTYAEHLGLDPESAVRQFKEEASGAIPKSELYMPKPVPEGRVPGGTMLLMALVLAGGVYGGWYYLTSTGRDMVDLVPPLPDRLASALDLGTPPPEVVVPVTEPPEAAEVPVADQFGSGQSDPGQPPSGQAGTDLPQAEPQPAGTVVADGSGAPAAPPAPADQAGTSPAASAQATTAAEAPPAPGTDGAGTETASTEDEDESNGLPAAPTALDGSSGSAPGPATASPSTPTPTVALPEPEVAAAPPAPPAVPAPAAEAPTGRVYGVANGPSRIQLRATQDSWIQVRDGAGDLLFARVLRPGDVYRAPDQSGLKLVTGNAGGLVAVVDGVQAPRPFGQTGQVMRDVALDPQRMANP